MYILNKKNSYKGTRNPLGSIINVKNLTPNENYCFAVGAYD